MKNAIKIFTSYFTRILRRDAFYFIQKATVPNLLMTTNSSIAITIFFLFISLNKGVFITMVDKETSFSKKLI